jgi:diguanylate cyclase (GGDEF)-like protein/PAS domain S-box-containing protein
MLVKEIVLVVDDEDANRDLLSRRLTRSGFQVEVARGGDEALGKVSQTQFDLILLDQMMPGKTGSDVLRELRTQYSQADLPVIMVTAITDSGRVAEALDLGANDYITKPVDFTVALARIRAQLSRKHAETARRVSEERYELAARASNDGLWDWDLVSNEIYYSERWKSTMGLRDAQIGKSPEEWLSRVHADDVVSLRAALQRHLDQQSEFFEAEYRIRRGDGECRWMTGRGMAVRSPDGTPSRMAGSQSDITEKKTLDALTGLPNRLLFHERLCAAVDRARFDPDYRLAVYFVDLDRFKLVNDTLGHVAGDHLLMQFGERLRSVVAGQCSLVARLGGDEFAVLLEGVGDSTWVVAQGDRLIRAIRPAFQLEEREFFVSASVGIVVSRPEHRAAEDLIRDADLAMYSAKARGLGRCAIFDESMRQIAHNRLQIETDLRVALTRGQLLVYYQPRVDLNTSQICGFEALLRWKHPQRGLVQPDDFILDVAVNISPVQLRDPALVQQIAQILAETGLPPGALQIEITESRLLENLDEARDLLLAIKALGVGLKLDDFATGYSCLRYLYRLPFDTIKIDRSFTMDLDDNNPESKELVRTILSMAQNLSLGVIAEGIESQSSADFLREEGCRFGQGYHFSPGVSAESAEDMLRDGIAT